MDLFTLVARLGLDSSEYEKGIRESRSSFAKMADAVTAKAVAVGQLTARLVEKAASTAMNLGKSAIDAAAEVSAENAQFAASFGELQGAAKKTFNEIGKDTGVLVTRLRTVGTKAFSQFKGAGIESVEALEQMDTYTRLAADAAAYYDMSLEDADERLRSFLRGNTEAGDAIGLFTSESQRNSAAMEKYGQKWQKLNEAQKQMLMLDIANEIYKQSGAIGQAARESDNWANVVGNLKEGWRQALARFGTPIMVALTPVVKDVTECLQDPEVQLKLEQFGIAVGNAITAVVDFILGIPSKDETARQLNRWWQSVKAMLNPFSVTATVKVQKVQESLESEGVKGAFSTAVDEAWWNPKNWGTSTKQTESGTVYESTHGGYGAGFATGLDYVPYNDFAARLHEGEAVLTKTEAEAWRKRDAGGNASNAELLEEIRLMRLEMAQRREVFTPDGRVLGDITTQTVSGNIARGARNRRFNPA